MKASTALVDLLFQHRRHLEASGRLGERLGRMIYISSPTGARNGREVFSRDSPELTRLRGRARPPRD